MGRHTWSDEECAELAKVLARGKRPSEIAKLICNGKFSKSAINGVIRRAGGPEKFCAAHGHTFLGDRLIHQSAQSVKKRKIALDPSKAIFDGHVLVRDRKENQCAFPVKKAFPQEGVHLCCGAEIENSRTSYCAEHQALVRQESRPIGEKRNTKSKRGRFGFHGTKRKAPTY